MQITRIAIIDVSASMDSPFMYRGESGLITRSTSVNHKFEAAKEYLRYAIQKMPPVKFAHRNRLCGFSISRLSWRFKRFVWNRKRTL